MRTLLPLLPIGLLLLPAPAAAAAGKAWAWVDQPAIPIGFSGTPSLQYQYNSLGGTITIQRIDTGEWHVTIPGMSGTGVAHVTAYGGAHRCSAAVLPAYIYVGCLQTTDNPVAAQFSIFYYEEDATPIRQGGYLYAPPVWLGGQQPCSIPTSVWNSSGGGTTLNCGPAESTVTFQSLTMNRVSSVAFGSYPSRGPYCGVTGWSPGLSGIELATVRFSCRNGGGTESTVPVEGASVSLFRDVRFGELNHRGGFAYANQKAAASYTPSTQYHTSGSAITVTRLATGRYRVFFSGMASSRSTAVAQVVRTPDEPLHCSVVNWVSTGLGTDVQVKCYQANGENPSVPADARFNVMYLTSYPVEPDQH